MLWPLTSNKVFVAWKHNADYSLLCAGGASGQLDEHAFVPCSSYTDDTLSYVQVTTAQGVVNFQNVSICGLLDAVPNAVQNHTTAFSVNATAPAGALQSTTFNTVLLPDSLLAMNATIFVTNVTTFATPALVTVATSSSAPTSYQSSPGSLLLSALPTASEPPPSTQAVLGQPASTADCPVILSSCALLSQASNALGCAQFNVTSAPACYNISGSSPAVSDPLECTAALGLLSICGFNPTCSALASNVGCVRLLICFDDFHLYAHIC